MRGVAALTPAWVASLIIATFALTLCTLPAKDGGPFQGKVVALDTGKPIPGVAVLAVWDRPRVDVFGGYTFYDLRVAVTDAQGAFELPRLPMPWRPGIRLSTFAWFVPGYTAVNVVRSDSSHAPTLIEMRELKHVDPETLRKLPFRHSEGMPHEIPFDIRPEVHWAVNQQRRALGLPPLGESWSHPTTPDHGGRRVPDALMPRAPMPAPLPPPAVPVR